MKYLLAITALLLSGCAGFDTLQGGIADRGAKASDEAVETAEFVLCRGVSVGAWVRRYGQNAQLAEAWRVLCGVSILNLPK